MSTGALRRSASQGRVDARDQFGLRERLAEEAHCPAFQRARPDLIIGKGGDEDEWNAVSIADHARLELQAAHYSHLHVRDHAGRDLGVTRAEKILCRSEDFGVEASML
jgi:hypothetical protein